MVAQLAGAAAAAGPGADRPGSGSLRPEATATLQPGTGVLPRRGPTQAL